MFVRPERNMMMTMQPATHQSTQLFAASPLRSKDALWMLCDRWSSEGCWPGPAQEDAVVHGAGGGTRPGPQDRGARTTTTTTSAAVTSKPPHKQQQRQEQREVYAWTRQIVEQTKRGQARQALQTYDAMRAAGAQPNPYTWVAVLKACGSAGELETAKRVHAEVTAAEVAAAAAAGEHSSSSSSSSSVVVATALVTAYAKCGSLADARAVFEHMPRRDAVAWNAIISGYAGGGGWDPEEAVRLYRRMRREGVPPDARTFVGALKACGSCCVSECGGGGGGAGDAGGGGDGLFPQQQEQVVVVGGSRGRWLDTVRSVHAHAVECKCDGDEFVCNMLIDVYAKCGSLDEARRVFEQMRQRRSTVSWNSLIHGYAQTGASGGDEGGEEVVRLYSRMAQEGVAPDDITYVGVLKACTSSGCVASSSSSSSSSSSKWLSTVEAIHKACVVKQQEEVSVLVGTMLIAAYAKCGSPDSARQVFDAMLPRLDVVAWTAMISGYAQAGRGEAALALYKRMRDEGAVAADALTLVAALKACCCCACAQSEEQERRLDAVRGIHRDAKKAGLLLLDAVVSNTLVEAYGKCGSVEDARRAFDAMPSDRRNSFSWNAMMWAHVQAGQGEAALELYARMQGEGASGAATVPNDRTYVAALQACSALAEQEEGEEEAASAAARCVHADAVRGGWAADAYVGSALVDAYAKCGNLEDARCVFESMPVAARTVVSWNAMVSGYARMGDGDAALALYARMLQQQQQQEQQVVPDERTYAAALKACAAVAASRCLDTVRAVHAQVGDPAADAVLGTLLVDAYAKCGSVDEARAVFERMPRRDVVAWSAMVAGYARAGGDGGGEEAVRLYRAMQAAGVAADARAVAAGLTACASASAAGSASDTDLLVQAAVAAAAAGVEDTTTTSTMTALIALYAKSGRMSEAQEVFDALPSGSRVTAAWNALLAGYARQGGAATALAQFERMRRAAACEDDGARPDEVTLLALLTACNHAGMVDEGRRVLAAVTAQYGVAAGVKHLTCVVDMLGRAGRVAEAEAVALAATGPPDAAVWGCVLAACRKWGDVERGRRAFQAALAAEGRPVVVPAWECW